MMSLTKRFVSLLLVLVMALSMLPASAFAEESTPADLVEITVDAQNAPAEVPAEETVLIEGEGEIPVVMEPVVTEETEPDAAEESEVEIPAGMNELEIVPAIEEAELEIEAEQEAEGESEMDLASIPMLLAVDKTFALLDNQISVHESAGVGKDDSTFGAGGLIFHVGGKAYSTTAMVDTITVYNNIDTKARVSFKYYVMSYETPHTGFKIDGETYGDVGSYTAILKAGEYVTVQISSPLQQDEADLYMYGFAIEALPEQTEVAFVHDDTLGSVNYNVINNSVVLESGAMANGTVRNVSTDYGITLTAEPKSDARFLGWIEENDAYAEGSTDTDADGALLSTESTYTYIPSANTTIKAVFMKNTDTNPWFMVGTTTSTAIGVMGVADQPYYNVIPTHLFDNFETAAEYSANSTSKAMVLLNDATLTGTHTVPAGVSLLIPFDTQYTMYKTAPWAIETDYVDPVVYRKLTLASGAKLVLDGEMSVSGQHRVTQGSRLDGCAPIGNLAFVDLKEDSQIVINTDGALYAYGYVTGAGKVIAESGAEVYELFQIADFRGGTQTTNMYNAKERVFMLSQYYVQNIEAELTLKAGAIEHSYATLFMQSMREASSIAFIGSGSAMFNLKSGYVTKRYDGATDRLVVEAHGELSVKPISLTVGPTTLSSTDYVLPINGNISVKIFDGASITLEQDIALLPGAEIIIDEGAVCRLEKGRNVYVYDADDWDDYCGPLNLYMVPIKYAPSKSYDRTNDRKDATILVNGEMDASGGYLYTTKNKANIYSTSTTGKAVAKVQSGLEAVTYQIHQEGDQSLSWYHVIDVTSAQLKNADGSYTQTANIERDYLNFVYKDGVWDCNHEYPTEPSSSKASTCYEAGYKKYICVQCGKEKTETLEKLAHNPVTVQGKAATCTESGLTAGEKCGVEQCGAWIQAQTEIPAFGHTPKTITEAVEPTCTAAGHTAEIACATCGAPIQASEPVAAKGHTPKDVPGKEATCEQPGLTAGSVCSVCGATITEQVEIPAFGHAWGEGEVTTAPNCTTDGVRTFTCGNCGETKTEVEPQLGHNMVYTDEVPATCTQPGSASGGHCDRCDYATGAGEIPALGHSWNAGEITTQPGCTTAGEKLFTCGACGETKTEAVAALGHTEVTDKAVAATCTSTGKTEGKHCSVCGTVTLAQEVVPAKPHTEVIDKAVEATCVLPGKTEGKHCSVCNTVITAQTTVAAKGHSNAPVAAVAPTCTATGLTEGSACSVCGTVEKAQEIVAALGHDMVDGEVVTPAACLTAGVKNVVCQREGCGAKETAPIAALGHAWADAGIKTEPSCTLAGMKNLECMREGCDAVGFAEIPAKGHTEVEDKAVEPTCTETGLTAGIHCSACKAIIKAQEVVPAKGHTEVVDPAVDANCTDKTGLTEGKHCGVCGKVLVAQKEVPAGHKFDVAPCQQAPATCQRCGYVEKNKVDHKLSSASCTESATCLYGCGYVSSGALGHTPVIDPDFPAMCDFPGMTEGSHCSVCGEILKAQEEIPALGHAIRDYEAKKPTFTSVGWEAYEACLRCSYSTYVEIPMLTGAEINDFDSFMNYLPILETLAAEYVKTNPGKDPLNLVIKYIRTGVDRYNSGSWGIMAGYEEPGFAKFVGEYEDELNAVVTDPSQMVVVSGLKNINEFKLPNGDRVDFGHMFGTMDITYHNYGSQNHADVGGWAGDLVDLLSTADRHNVSGTLEEMVKEISEKYLGVALNESDTCSTTDIYGDLDAYYIMHNLDAKNYKAGDLTNLMKSYFVKTLTDVDRAEYLMNNRLNGSSVRNDLRRVVYNEYTSNKMVSTLEGTREFINDDLSDLRKACCYAFADYICYLAGDYVNVTTNPYYTVFATESTTLAPGITQQINHATSADGKQMVYYLATGDLTRSDVTVYANYKDNDPSKGWGMQRVLDQANAAQERHSHIENYNVIASINGAGYDMATGEPGGLLVMEGVEYHPVDRNGFFAIMKDGTPKIGTTEEYYQCKDQIQEAIAGFGTQLVRNGELAITATSNYYSDRASRTAIGITKTGKVVFMVLDGRQEPVSCGGSMIEIAQIMQEAGCVEAINLDGGGSTTYVARLPGDDELSVVSKPSDGVARSVSTSLFMVSTAPSSTAFDHAVLESDVNYLTVGSSVQMTASGVSATGNAVALPEGVTWSVSDARWATITDDGVLTAQRNGSVEVYMKLGEEIVGRTTLYIVVPQQVYFTKSSVDAVYGASVELPVKALYENKPVAIKPSDLVFTLSNENAGSIDGFKFTAKEGSGLKNLKITVALANDPNANATISVALYKQGEASFDFDQATGGTRILAWDRQVTNSVTDDNNTYTVVDMSKDMVTSYVIALDMSQIPIPEQISDLTYMLPGADMEDASAWKFLLQLAERISVLSEVRASMTFDKNVDVDYSGLTVVNEYFAMKDVSFDAATNTLTLTVGWIDQTQPINEDEAKPLCIVSGIKVTPKKDAPWDAKDRLKITNSGEISYKIYMRANGLYSFCQKVENQVTYGLQPFINPNDESEKGGWFQDTYTTFSDSYNLVNLSLNGWVNDEGGYAYYVNGEKQFGIKEVEGYYYDFGKNGINVGQTKFTGLFYDESAKAYRYSNIGELQTGWAQIEGEWYYFLSNGDAANGTLKIGGIHFDFEENGKLVSGAWVNLLGGLRYYFGPDYYWRHWQQIDGEWYYFWDGYAYTGYKYIRTIEDNTKNLWYDLGEDGRYRGVIADGLHEFDGKLYLTKDGVQLEGLYKVGEDYYFFAYSGDVKRDQTYYAYETHCDLPCSNYYFLADGRMANGVVETSDGLCYYEKGKPGKIGLTKWNGDYYFVGSNGKLAISEKYAYETNCDLGVGTYTFGSDGKMLRGVVQTEEGLLYYKNGKLVTGKAGITKIDGTYYYVDKNGKCLTGTVDCTATNCDLPKGTYIFGADGKILNGVVATDKGNVYYENGVAGGNKEGLSKIGDDYYFIGIDGQFATGEYYVSNTNSDLPRGNYEFASDGKLLNGIVKMKDGVYYYEKGIAAGNKAGLTKVGNDYYLVDYTGKCETGKCYAWKTNCDLPRGYYEFGADGKMLQGIVETSNGVFFYENGNPSGSKVGLNKFGDAYYFVSYTGKCETGSYYAWKTNCDLPRGSYEFGSDGKMLDGFVKKADGIYYYIMGKAAAAGVYRVDGYFYCVQNNSGKLVVSQKYKVVDPKNVLIEGTYTFNELGQITG